MRNQILGSILTVILSGAVGVATMHSQAQVFPTAAVLLSNNTIKHHTINSTEEYLQMEHSLNILSGKLQRAYELYPNMQYTPVYDNDNTVGFVITGVSNASDANDISYSLMQLEAIGDMINHVDDKYIPEVDSKNKNRVKKSVASR